MAMQHSHDFDKLGIKSLGIRRQRDMLHSEYITHFTILNLPSSPSSSSIYAHVVK